MQTTHTSMVLSTLCAKVMRMGKYAPVSAAEAHARDGENRPVCECCGELKRWKSRRDCPPGGHYICPKRAREANKRYAAKNPEKERARVRAYTDRERESIRARHRARYFRRVRSGLCGSCGRANDTSDTTCSYCSSRRALFALGRTRIY